MVILDTNYTKMIISNKPQYLQEAIPIVNFQKYLSANG
jgi:hypothetical protein